MLPEDRSQLPKFDSDATVCKWHLFFSNLTEDEFQAIQETFILDCKRQLKFVTIPGPENTDAATGEPDAAAKPIPENDELLKGSSLFSCCLCSYAYPNFISLLYCL